jgi:hypothetical protein
MPYLQRTIVKDVPGAIGGHCIIPNAKLIDNPIGDFVIEQNSTHVV